MTLENKNEKFAEEIISLDKTVKKLKALNSNNWEKITDDIYIDKKSIDDKKYNNWKLEREHLKAELESLKLSNKNLLNIINNLEIRPLDFYLYDTEPDRFEKIIINENGDVEYKGKVLYTDDGKPLNKDTASTTLELKVLFAAMRIEPREGCDTSKNGTLGCYIDIPD